MIRLRSFLRNTFLPINYSVRSHLSQHRLPLTMYRSEKKDKQTKIKLKKCSMFCSNTVKIYYQKNLVQAAQAPPNLINLLKELRMKILNKVLKVHPPPPQVLALALQPQDLIKKNLKAVELQPIQIMRPLKRE